MKEFIPYGKQLITNEDIKEVIKILKSDWLTTGPNIEKFERKICDFVGAKYCVAFSSGTSALHGCMYAIGIKKGDEVIVPTLTFLSTANCVVFQNGKPVFVDVDEEKLLIDPKKIYEKINKKTKAIISVDYGGHPCDYEELENISKKFGLFLIADASHSLGAKYKGKNVGTLADLTVFSFHPVKIITTGEGGAVVTNNEEFYIKLKRFRNHGINLEVRERLKEKILFYKMEDIGYNYRITDFQCILGISQLKKIKKFLKRRNQIAEYYTQKLSNIKEVEPLKKEKDIYHAYHLYVVKLPNEKIRDGLYLYLREKNIGTNVHYYPVHLQPFYLKKFGTYKGMCPVAEEMYKKILSLPIYPSLKKSQIDYVIKNIKMFFKK